MIPAYWFAVLPSYLWQVVLHSAITGLIFFGWAELLRLPSGRTKRRLLALVLVLPLVTAAVPGRGTLEFRGRLAWMDSASLLAIPLIAGIRIYHVVLCVGVMVMALTFWQELMPALRRRGRRYTTTIPRPIAHFARGLPGWAHCRIVSIQDEAIVLATSGWPGHPRLVVSRGALDRLTAEEQQVVIRHEHAHWLKGRWLRSYALFAVRLAQCYNPVALWAFREYCLEVEIECDREAMAGRHSTLLPRVLLSIYESTDSGDASTRSALRKRVDVLLDADVDDDALPRGTVVAAAAVLLVILPWVV